MKHEQESLDRHDRLIGTTLRRAYGRGQVSAPGDLLARIHAQLAAETSQAGVAWWRRPRLVWGTAAVAVTAMVVLTLVIGGPSAYLDWGKPGAVVMSIEAETDVFVQTYNEETDMVVVWVSAPTEERIPL